MTLGKLVFATTAVAMMYFLVALVVWVGFLYFMVKSIVQAQGLPVGADLMPK